MTVMGVRSSCEAMERNSVFMASSSLRDIIIRACTSATESCSAIASINRISETSQGRGSATSKRSRPFNSASSRMGAAMVASATTCPSSPTCAYMAFARP
ncbi:hypothetical protein D3C72_1797150 [compost metagenome]